MAFRPLHDRALLRRLDTEATTKGGIIIPDPAKVVRTALRDAASVAGLLVTTEALVADRPKDKSALPAPAVPGF